MLQFNPVSHTYAWGGQYVPSVTQILQPVIDYSGIPAHILDAARDRGTRVHKATELDDLGTLDPASVTEDIAGYLDAWRAFKRERGVAVLESEKQVYNGEQRYAGTLDAIVGLDDGHEYLIDKKATATIKASVGPQTAAYHAAYGSPKLRRAVIQLNPDGSYRWRVLDSPRDWLVFQACLLVHRFNLENRNV